jgi:hypothetical protein
VLTAQFDNTVIPGYVTSDETRYPPTDLGFTVPPALRAIDDSVIHRRPGHIITAPVEGAELGDMLELRIDAIDLGPDYGFCWLTQNGRLNIMPLLDFA